PATRRPASRPGGEEIVAAFAADLARSSGVEIRLAPEHRRRHGPEDLPGWIEKVLASAPELGAEVGPERLRRLFEVFRANAQALADFTPRPDPGRLILFRSAEGPARDSKLGWGTLAGDVTMHVL